jgi:cell division protein FtsQ
VNTTGVMRWATAALVTASGVLVAAALVMKFAHSPRFDLRRIEVVGDVHHISRAAVRAAISGRLVGNYFTIHLDQARRAFETLPWVAQVSVRRIWPDRLRVTLTEHRALGEWSDGRLVSDAGVLFVANPAEAEADGPLVSFAGPPRYATDAVDRFRRFSALLSPLQLRIAALHISDRAIPPEACSNDWPRSWRPIPSCSRGWMGRPHGSMRATRTDSRLRAAR